MSTTSQPPHPAQRTVALDGVHAYADRQAVPAGGTIAFHVSAAVPTKAAVYRLGPLVDDPSGDTLLHEYAPAAPAPQDIAPGSYVHVPRGIPPSLLAAEPLAVEIWIRPWNLFGQQGVVSQFDSTGSCTFALTVEEGGHVGFYVGDGGAFDEDRLHVSEDPLLVRKQWHHVAATWDPATGRKRLYVDGVCSDTWTDAAPTQGQTKHRAAYAPIRIGALAVDGKTDTMYDGDIAMPCLYLSELPEAYVAQRFRERAHKLPERGHRLFACWPLTEEKGQHIIDVARQADPVTCPVEHAYHDGFIINHGTWMIGGPDFEETAPYRFNYYYHPDQDKTRGHGLRLCSDDLYDCKWDPTYTFTVPRDAKSGTYVLRIKYHLTDPDADLLYHVTFIVTRPKWRKAAPLLVLCSSNTWRQYNSTPFAIPKQGLSQFWVTAGCLDRRDPEPHPPATGHPAQPPVWGGYRPHCAGQPPQQVPLRVPFPTAGPYVAYSPPEIGYSHLLRQERFTHVWLEANGYEFDMTEDLDFHQRPEQLADYKAILIAGHSEYWSDTCLLAVDRFMEAGGNAVILSGNSFVYRVSFSPDDPAVMECRKFKSWPPGWEMGEVFHSQDRRRGNVVRESMFPFNGYKFSGLECVGWSGTHKPEFFTSFTCTNPDHFIFKGTGLKEGDTFGHGPGGSLPRAVGHEWDIRISRMFKLAPPSALAPPVEEPEGIETLAVSKRPGEEGSPFFGYHWANSDPIDNVLCEMIFWERPRGGAVFNAGTIGFGWVLPHDKKLCKVLANVLERFECGPTGRPTSAL